MKPAAICLSVAFGVASQGTLAQSSASDSMEKLRACSLLEQAARLECLEKLSRDMAPPQASSAPEAAGAVDNWVVSETTSPIDYTPITTATASYKGSPDGAAMLLSIQCRSGRTDLVIDSSTVARRGQDYIVSYTVNNGQPVAVTTSAPPSGTGIAIRADVGPLLAALPDRGEITFRVAARQGATLEGRYALAGMKAIVNRLAGPCKWPTTGAPRNR
jgi:hypothetical protein